MKAGRSTRWLLPSRTSGSATPTGKAWSCIDHTPLKREDVEHEDMSMSRPPVTDLYAERRLLRTTSPYSRNFLVTRNHACGRKMGRSAWCVWGTAGARIGA
jgi:hypothetical protein